MHKLLNKAFFRKLIISPILPLVISLVISIPWYRSGLLIGGAEESLSFAFPQRTMEFYRYAWNDAAFGAPQTVAHSRYPFFYLSSLLVKLGLEPGQVQAGAFILLYALGGFGVYLFLSELFGKAEAAFGSVFYLINTYTYANIWHRFISPIFFFYPLFPLSLYFFYLLLKKRKLKFLFLFILVNSIFSYAYSSPALIITQWVPLGILAVSEYLTTKSKKFSEKFLPIAFLLLAILLWALTNWWWIRYVLYNSVSYYGGIFSPEFNLSVLKSLSSQQPFSIFGLLRYPNVIPNIFNYLNLIIPILALSGFVLIKDKFQKLAIILIVAITFFMLNGTNFPTGFIMEFIFQKLSFMQLFRNPYEKFGIVLILIYAMLIGKALSYLYRKKIYLFLIIVIVAGFAHVFLWRISVFGGKEYNAYIKVPESYTDLKNYLSTDKSVYRLLTIPMIRSDGVKFNWETPFSGIQPYMYIFQQSSLDKVLGSKDFNQYWKALRQSYYEGRLDELAGYGNIKYLVVEKDLDGGQSNLDTTEKETSYLQNGILPDIQNKTVICKNYVAGSPCDVSSIDFRNIIFITIKFASGFSGNIRLDLQDNNNEHLDFSGDVDGFYRIYPLADSFTFDLRNPTERYAHLNISKLKYLTITVPEGELRVNEISVNKGRGNKTNYYDEVISTKNVDLLKLKGEYFVPRIYSPSYILKTTDWNSLLNLGKLPAAFIFENDVISESEIDFSTDVDTPPKITFRAETPAKYVINANEITSPFWLVFSEAYDPRWKLVDLSGGYYLPFKINGMSNGYFISRQGNDSFVLEFKL